MAWVVTTPSGSKRKTVQSFQDVLDLVRQWCERDKEDIVIIRAVQ